jgi:glycosyltransferase involved in cell wall biosynthesis
MHVGLNLIFLVPGETGGTEVYARELIPELLAARPDIRFTAFVNRETAEIDGPWRELIPAVTVPVRASRRVEWVRGEQLLLPRLAAAAGVDVLHSLGNTAPASGRMRRVVTIHDLLYLMVPDAHFGLRGLGMRVLVPLAAHRSHRIVAISNSTKGDVVEHLHVRSDKVDVVYQGLGATPAAAPLDESVLRRRHDVGHRRIALSVSTKRAHKNLGRLLEAVALIPPESRPVLFLPGYPTPYEDELKRTAHTLGIDRDVRFLGWIGADELEGLYAAAECFVFPSVYEGFGFTVLEAMRRGVPVACSGRSAVGEVAGDAALVFDPESAEAIAAAIRRLLEDSALAQRLREQGRLRAAEFSWKATARGTAAAYERAFAA